MAVSSDHTWQGWKPDREPTDNELLAMTDEEFLAYADAVERYARHRRREQFSCLSMSVESADTK